MKTVQSMNVELNHIEPEILKPEKNNALITYKNKLPDEFKNTPHHLLPDHWQFKHIQAMCYFFQEIIPNLSERLFQATSLLGSLLTQENFSSIQVKSMFSSTHSDANCHEAQMNIQFTEDEICHESTEDVHIDVKDEIESLPESTVKYRQKTRNIWDSPIGTISLGKQIFKLFPQLKEKDNMLFIVSVLAHIQNTIDLNALDCDFQMDGFINEEIDDFPRTMQVVLKVMTDKNSGHSQTNSHLH